jgi:hypothetical protein
MRYSLFILLKICLFASSVQAEIIMTSQDFLLKPENVLIKFNSGIINSNADISYRTCSDCSWTTYPTTNKTRFYSDRRSKSFDEFKNIINSKQPNNKKVLISISHYSKSVRILKWQYEAD